jgi:superfamily II DNA/RNA helicase
VSETADGHSREAFPLVCQVLARDATNPPNSQASLLRRMPPHVLVATPNGLQDVYKTDPEALQLETLSTVVLDEADEMISAVPTLKDKKKKETIRKRIEKHLHPTSHILDVIYASRIKANLDPNQAGGKKRHRSDPQLIVSSATLRTNLKRYLYGEKGLLRRGKLQKIFGVGFEDEEEHDMEGHREARGEGNLGRNITHCALLVSTDGTVRNIPSAAASSMPQENTQTDKDVPDSFFDSFQEVESKPALSWWDSQKTDESAMTVEASALINNRVRSPFDPNVLEAIATCFALEVSTEALLVLPSSAPVKRAVAELQELGIDAQALELTKGPDGQRTRTTAEPTMVVATTANIRGMDLPELSHVFLIANQGLKPDDYLHIAGRVGRFGKSGKMVCVLEEAGSLRVERLLRIYKRLGVECRRLELFE